MKELEKENAIDFNLFTVHGKIALILANTEYLFVLNTLVGNKDMRGEIHKNYIKVAENGQDLKSIVKAIVGENKILDDCQKLLEFKYGNGRGLPWSLKKEIAVLMHFMREGYVFPMPSDHRELIEILDYMSYFSTKGLLPR